MMSWKQYAAVSQFLNNSSLTSKDGEIKRGTINYDDVMMQWVAAEIDK